MTLRVLEGFSVLCTSNATVIDSVTLDMDVVSTEAGQISVRFGADPVPLIGTFDAHACQAEVPVVAAHHGPEARVAGTLRLDFGRKTAIFPELSESFGGGQVCRASYGGAF